MDVGMLGFFPGPRYHNVTGEWALVGVDAMMSPHPNQLGHVAVVNHKLHNAQTLWIGTTTQHTQESERSHLLRSVWSAGTEAATMLKKGRFPMEEWGR
jgi:hypothetical protein